MAGSAPLVLLLAGAAPSLASEGRGVPDHGRTYEVSGIATLVAWSGWSEISDEVAGAGVDLQTRKHYGPFSSGWVLQATGHLSENDMAEPITWVLGASWEGQRTWPSPDQSAWYLGFRPGLIFTPQYGYPGLQLAVTGGHLEPIRERAALDLGAALAVLAPPTLLPVFRVGVVFW